MLTRYRNLSRLRTYEQPATNDEAGYSQSCNIGCKSRQAEKDAVCYWKHLDKEWRASAWTRTRLSTKDLANLLEVGCHCQRLVTQAQVRGDGYAVLADHRDDTTTVQFHYRLYSADRSVIGMNKLQSKIRPAMVGESRAGWTCERARCVD